MGGQRVGGMVVWVYRVGGVVVFVYSEVEWQCGCTEG